MLQEQAERPAQERLAAQELALGQAQEQGLVRAVLPALVPEQALVHDSWWERAPVGPTLAAQPTALDKETLVQNYRRDKTTL